MGVGFLKSTPAICKTLLISLNVSNSFNVGVPGSIPGALTKIYLVYCMRYPPSGTLRQAGSLRKGGGSP